MSAKRAILFLSAALVFGAGVRLAAADPLLDAYQSVLADPTNSEVNLQYALVAEGNKKYRLALAAYERILANDPNNKAALAGLQRVRRIIQPASTLFTTEFGARFESNPLQVATGAKDELFPYSKLHVRDERNLFGTRWRTTADLWGEYHPVIGELSNANAFADTGPVIDVPGTQTAVHPAIGAAAGYFNGRFAYSEVNLSDLIEGYLDGANQWARIRAGYRNYAPNFGSTGGVYVGADGRLSRDHIFSESDVVSVTPWLLWSDIPGSVLDINSNHITPGRYIQGGAKFEYDRAVSSALTVGVFVGASERAFATDPADSGGHRQDFLVSPGMSLLFTNIFGIPQTDFRIDYQYDHNHSNAAADSYDDHTVTLALVSRR
jgi:hypothetical protein